MKAPLSWLKEYVDIDIDVKELSNKLVSIGFEVEEIIDLSKTFSNVVVCQILNIEKHPDADKLSVCKIDIGTDTLQIVTNATNIKVGDKVPVALDGAILATGQEIKKGKLRGVESDGMFCGGEELNADDSVYIGASNDSVLVLDACEIIGTSMINVLGFNDYILDIGVTPNRPDCNSILGIARETAVALGKKCKIPEIEYNAGNKHTSDFVSVDVIAKDLCPNYNLQAIYNIKIAQSPLWMTRRLHMMGIKSINNIIDITNYVLSEIGQPMHAFDYRDIDGKCITIRRAKNGETIIPFDEKTYSLSNDNLIIADTNKAIALAGIMGGINSGIKSDTDIVLFESAKFIKENIRHTSRTLGIRSDSSARFEKGVEAYTADFALKRALYFIEKLNAGEITDNAIKIGDLPTINELTFPYENIEKLLGINIPQDICINILNNLHIETDIKNNNVHCIIPQYREDIERDCDIIEELIRVYGYQNIKPTLLKKASITKGGKTNNQKIIDNIKDILVGDNYNEITTYSFVGKNLYDKQNKSCDNSIRLKNALGEELSIMRDNLTGNMLNAISLNLNKGNKALRFFEYSRIYIPHQLPLKELPDEINTLCVGISDEKYQFNDIFGSLKLMFNYLNIEYKVERSNNPLLHPGVSADIFVNDICIGFVGKIHPQISKNFDIDKNTYIAEINADKLIEMSLPYKKYNIFGKYPTSSRDIAIVVDDEILSGNIQRDIQEISDMILSVELFDVYKNLSLVHKKSLAYNIVFGSNERTLKDSEIDSVINKILVKLSDKYNAKLRS